jgi:hypothetical protein
MGGVMSSIVVSGDTSGAVTLAVPAVAGTNTVTIAAQTGTLNAAGPAFSAYRGSNQTLTQNTYVKVQINTESFDTNSNFDSTTNYRFTPTVAGYYQLNAQMQLNTSSGVLFIAIYKNGTQAQASGVAASFGAGSVLSISSLVSANGSTDYFEIFVYSDNASPQINGSTNSFFSGYLVRGA